MQGGRIGAATAIASAAILGAVLIGTAAAANAASTTVALLRLDVLLTVAPDLRDPARRTLIAEAARIWRHEQVQLAWPAPAGGTERPDAPLRILVISRPDVAAGEERWPVAEILPHQGHRAIAIASITSARRVVNEAARYRLIEHPGHLEYRLGLVLGRAVAHEIGHFLLATATHADSGLMRASVDAGEFAGLSAETFRLDEDAREWIRQRVTADPAAVHTAGRAGFSYQQQ